MKLLKYIIASSFLLFSCCFAALAQRSLSGKVTDSSGEGVLGAGVVVKGTTNGAVTDIEGNWTIASVKGEEVTLEVSCLGYTSTTVVVPADKATVNIILTEDNLMLEETVVVGYGTQKKVNLTGAITAVKGDEIQNRTAHDVTSMLQGSVPGLNITTSSGIMNETPDINIRGYTSINGASPMVLIDGAEGDLSRVNPQDVESISVIKDGAAAAVYGARAAFGVILVTTKAGNSNGGNATVRYSGRWGWQAPTTSTDFETRGYWSVYTINKFWDARYPGDRYLKYDDNDMNELLARVNDVTENQDRPWVVEETVGGVKQWKYYANTDWYHTLFSDRNPAQQQSVSITGGGKDFKYFISGMWDNQQGILKINPDIINKYQLRARFEGRINKYATISNNTSYYDQTYSYLGIGTSNIDRMFTMAAAHALPCFPFQNPDGSWVYYSQYFVSSYAVGNAVHIILSENKDKHIERKNDFTNTTELNITPFKQLKLTGNFTIRKRRNHTTARQTNFSYKQYPDQEPIVRTSGVGTNQLDEKARTYSYKSANVFATYEDTFGGHHLTAVAGGNYETQYSQYLEAIAYYLISDMLNDLSLAGTDADGSSKQYIDGEQSEYALMGYFGRVNYDYKGRYLLELSGRYDGSSRFAKGHRWGFFPSVSAGWRISEEPFFSPLKGTVNNLKLRASLSSLGNQVVSNYAYIRKITTDTANWSFGEGDLARTSSISSPNAGDLTWETVQQYNVGLDAGLLKDRLQFTGEAYIRNTLGMLVSGDALPAVYGASAPKQNSANLQTKGFELSLSWKDQFRLAGKPFGYGIAANVSNYASYITKYDNNPNKLLSDYYVGRRLGEIWGFRADDLFATDEEAQAYASAVDLSYVFEGMGSGWKAGDLKYVDSDGDGAIGIGSNTLDDPGDREVLGNSLPSLSYGATFSMDYMGFDLSAFFQGTGNHYWYPPRFCFPFWGPYSNPMQSFMRRDFLNDVWDYDNTDAYFPRARGYVAEISGGYLNRTNSRYLQNCRYLRLKNLTIGYTLPSKLSKKAGIEKVRVYFSGENLTCWSPLFKHCAFLDPEAIAHDDSEAYGRSFYPWQKTFMFGIDVQF
ncbi:MAG: TonB-dependent receptor [Bacteroidales bacterium]|nr:TonB-dependent receptor [Bacteroidales bacterium]